MQIALASDIHLEFGYFNPSNEADADVLVLAGDIFVARDIRKNTHLSEMSEFELKLNPPKPLFTYYATEFFNTVSRKYPMVLYVLGNHEHYDGLWIDTTIQIRNFLSNWPNILVLENQSTTIQDVTFYGTTFWMNFNNCDPSSVDAIFTRSNDFKHIKNDQNEFKYITIEDVVAKHKQSLNWLLSNAKLATNKRIVVTHHAPALDSLCRPANNIRPVDYYYASDCATVVADISPDLWLHGHVHKPSEYMIGSTRVVCNPRGYADLNQSQSKQYEFKIIRI